MGTAAEGMEEPGDTGVCRQNVHAAVDAKRPPDLGRIVVMTIS